jgi:hypothetical protein
MFVVVGGGSGLCGTCALGRGGARALEVGRDGARSPRIRQDEARAPRIGRGGAHAPGWYKAGHTSLGSGELEPEPPVSNEFTITPLNRLGKLVTNDHQSPFFGSLISAPDNFLGLNSAKEDRLAIYHCHRPKCQMGYSGQT